MPDSLQVIKIGGGIIDDAGQLDAFLHEFSGVEGPKILVHGGGKGASNMLQALGIAPRMAGGRRITDAATLDIVTMFYAGKTNKQLVAGLQRAGLNAMGLSGADGNLIRASRRPVGEVDFGFVGDLTEAGINVELLRLLLRAGLTPVCCAITHDGQGQLLNTNADTIASTLARALAPHFRVVLRFCFEKDGVLLNIDDPASVLLRLTPTQFQQLRAEGRIAAGMLPKLENAFAALTAGVAQVVIEHALNLNRPLKTVLCLD